MWERERERSERKVERQGWEIEKDKRDSGYYTWLLCLVTIPGHYTWLLYVVTIPGYYTWLIYLATVPGLYTWFIYLVTIITSFLLHYVCVFYLSI